MKTVPFRLRHLDEIAVGMETPTDMAAFRAVIQNAEGPAKTLLHEERPVGAFGILRAGDDGYSWAVFSDELRSMPFALHRTAKRELHAAAKDFTTVYGTVKEGWPVGQQWLERMGFRKERMAELPTGKVELWVLEQQ